MNLDSLMNIAPLDWQALLACLLCGTIVGLERQLRGKPVGIRTSSLIVLGTYVFIALSQGFLGAGVMLSKDGIVLGVTSAATIWALAAVGVAIAVATPALGIKIAVLIVVILVGVDIMENYSSALTRGVHSRYSAWRQRR